ncbi:hypothetical protein N9L49_03045 [Rhodospirillales bacterium]|nr:hypothetical protein [Rhodospirillales bacterium]
MMMPRLWQASNIKNIAIAKKNSKGQISMHASIKFRQITRHFVLTVGMIALVGCTQTANISANQAAHSGSSASTNAAEPQPSIFPDLPIPQGAKMNVDRTLVVGTEDWFGQLVLEASGNTFQMFDFYRNGLPKFGWAEITSVRAAVSVLTYEREQRILQMQIESGSLTGSVITITVSPRGIAKPPAS